MTRITKLTPSAKTFRNQVIKLSRKSYNLSYVDGDLRSHSKLFYFISCKFRGKQPKLSDKSIAFSLKLNEYIQLHMEELKQDKKFVQAALKLERRIYVRLIKGQRSVKDNHVRGALYTNFKQFRHFVLKSHHEVKINYQQQQLTILKSYFDNNQDSFLENEKNFINGMLSDWQRDLNKGKFIVFPKWYHCTRDIKTVDCIANSKIKVMHRRAYKGAFVSNKPEIRSYGNYCFAMGEEIEAYATKNNRVLPKFAIVDFYPDKEDALEVAQRHFTNTKGKLLHKDSQKKRIWVGFLNSILIARPKKDNDILAYHQSKKVAYLIVPEYDKRNFTHLSKYKILSAEEAELVERLINSAFPLVVPKSWNLTNKHK